MVQFASPLSNVDFSALRRDETTLVLMAYHGRENGLRMKKRIVDGTGDAGAGNNEDRNGARREAAPERRILETLYRREPSERIHPIGPLAPRQATRLAE